MLAIPILVSLLLVYYLSGLYRNKHVRQAYEIFARRNACEPPTQLEVKSSFGHKLSMLKQKYGDLFNDYYRGNFRRFGMTHAIFDGLSRPRVIHTIDPHNVRAAVLHAQDDWGVFTTRRNALKPFAQEGILTMEGHVWQHNRKIIFRSLNTRRSRDTQSVEPHVAALLQTIDEQSFDSGSIVDISGLLRRMAIDLTSEYMLGMSTGFQKTGSNVNSDAWQKEIDALFTSWNVVQDFMSLRSIMGSRYWLADGPKFRRACSHFRNFFDAYLTKIQSSNAETSSTKNTNSLAQELLQQLNDPIKVREVLIEVLIAGQNMVGVTLEWMIAELAARPDVYARLRNEVLAAFGTEDNESNARLMTWDNLQTCKTVQNVISETLRLHPLVPLVQRTANKDTVLPSGGGVDCTAPIAVAKGAHLTCNIYLFHRREEEWGIDAEVWNPDRWLTRKVPVDYMPFGAGVRICVGRQMSLTQMSFILARFAQHFESLTVPAGTNNLQHKLRPILAPKDGVKLILNKPKFVYKP